MEKEDKIPTQEEKAKPAAAERLWTAELQI